MRCRDAKSFDSPCGISAHFHQLSGRPSKCEHRHEATNDHLSHLTSQVDCRVGDHTVHKPEAPGEGDHEANAGEQEAGVGLDALQQDAGTNEQGGQHGQRELHTGHASIRAVPGDQPERI